MSTLKKYIDYLKANVGTTWTDHAKFAAVLAKVMKPETIVDLGVHKGYSTFAFGYYNKGIVYGVDHFMGDEQTGYYDTYQEVNDRNTYVKENFGVNNIEFIMSDFNTLAKKWDKPIDILHIDGLHTYEAVKNDFETWQPLCKDNSIILFHDIYSYWNTVGQFFSEIDGHKYVRPQSHGLGVFSKNEEILKGVWDLDMNIVKHLP